MIGEAVVGFHVAKEVKKAEVSVHVLDEEGHWRKQMKGLAQLEGVSAAIHIVPPLSNRICAYPANDLNQVLAQVKGGAVGIVFSPPEDWNLLTEHLDNAPEINALPSEACALESHIVRMHPVFQSLPSRSLMLQPYAELRPRRSFQHPSDESMACVLQYRPGTDEKPWIWGEDILVRRYGSGRLVFTDMPLVEQLGTNAVADHIFTNLLNHFVRRSVPSGMALPVSQPALEWMRLERKRTLARWMVLGAFSGAKEDALDHVFPPEKKIDFEGTYPGWYKVIQWRSWSADLAPSGVHCIDVHSAVDSPQTDRTDCSVYYLYGECVSAARQAVQFELESRAGMKIWLNDRLVGGRSRAEARSGRVLVEKGVLRQGRNQILIKVLAGPGEGLVYCGMQSAESAPLSVKWW